MEAGDRKGPQLFQLIDKSDNRRWLICLYDTEKYSVTRALNEAGVPVLSLETDYADTDAEQLRTRIGAFIELLNG